MGWRIVVISSRSKLDLKMNHLVVRKDNGVTKIFLDDISVIIVSSTAVSLTAALLNELSERKIKVIFCDKKRNPSFEIVPYYGSHNSSIKCRKQIRWSKNIKGKVWKSIIEEKIKNQMLHMQKYEIKEFKVLEKYLEEVEEMDKTNKEGHAAKVYFNQLFGMDFSRGSECPTNAALNYGYSILLSLVNREIVSQGYLTQLGIFHDNQFNNFNLGSDIMEPLRVFIDNFIVENGFTRFESEEKKLIIALLNEEVLIGNNRHTFLNATKIYVKSVLDALEKEDLEEIEYIDFFDR